MMIPVVAIVAVLAQFGIQPGTAFGISSVCAVPYPPSVPAPGLERTPAAVQVALADRAAPGASEVTFTIPLATLDEVRKLDRRPEVTDILDAARRYSRSRIHLEAYVTPDDVQASLFEAFGVADGLIIEVGVYLARRGVEADRISGRGMGIDSTIGRAVVVSFDITPSPLDSPSLPRNPWWPPPTDGTPLPSSRTGLSL